MPKKNPRLRSVLRKAFIGFAFFWLFLQVIYFVFTYQSQILELSTTPLSLFFNTIIPAQRVGVGYELLRNAYPFYFVITLASAAIGSLIISKGRSVEEALGIFVAFAIPQRRKLSGRVFDINTGENIPFITVRVIEMMEGKKVLIASAVTDFDGRYRINIVNKNRDLKVEVKAKDFKEYSKRLTNIYKNNVIQDIPLENVENVKNKIKSVYFYSLKPKIYIYFTYYLYVLSALSFFASLVSLRYFGLTLFGLIYVIIYAAAFVWNTKALFTRIRFGAGRILDEETKKPIPSATVGIYDENNQLQVVYTNRQGVVRINLPEGFYKINIAKDGYKMVNKFGEQIQFEELYITKDGYLPTDLYLKVTKSIFKNIQTSIGLANPFA